MYNNDTLNDIFEKTNGSCHLCGKRLSFRNYAKYGKRGNWEVEHSVPQNKGGSNYLRNLFPACISCNRMKSDLKRSCSIRKENGLSKLPASKQKREKYKDNGTITGLLIGARIAGPVGALLGALIGSIIGEEFA